jgi:hypothetical protein
LAQAVAFNEEAAFRAADLRVEIMALQLVPGALDQNRQAAMVIGTARL